MLPRSPPPPPPQSRIGDNQNCCQKLPKVPCGYIPARPSWAWDLWFRRVPVLGNSTGGLPGRCRSPGFPTKRRVARLQVCAQGRAELWPIKHFPNPLRFAKPQSFKEALCYLLKPSFNNKKPLREDPCSLKLCELSGAREALAVTVVGRWISQTGKYLRVGKRGLQNKLAS